MQLKATNREEFVSHLTKLKEDRFAKRFVAKCDMMKDWDKCQGIWIDGKLAGAIVVTISKRNPKVANLQLLHTFYEHRGKGVASRLCEYGLKYAYENKAEYFRVSSELDAVTFYKKFGFKMVCRQKTAQLAMFILTSPNIKENDMRVDEHIWKQMNRKGKGACVDCFVEYKGVDFYSA
jgi:GNAT superfamily N-acetyltransferase